MRLGVQQLIEEIIAPLLRKDGSDAELLSVDGGIVRVRVHGEAAFGSGARYTRKHFIEAPIRAVLPDAQIEFEMARPRPVRRQ